MAKITTPSESTVESAAPTLVADARQSQKALTVLALCQPGKPLHNFWLAPSQEAVQIAAAEIAHIMASKGKSARDIADVFALLGTGNASALRQFVETNITAPSGRAAEKAQRSVDLSSLGL